MTSRTELKARIDELNRALKNPNIVSYIYNRHNELLTKYDKYTNADERSAKMNTLQQLRKHASEQHSPKISLLEKISALEKEIDELGN